jgi:hypothetical protein
MAQLTMCIWLRHLPDQLRLLTSAFLLVSNRAGMRTASSHLGCPTHGSLCSWAIASYPRTSQSLLTCIPTSCSVARESWRVVHLGRAPWCLWHRCRHAVRHGQTGEARLLSQAPVARHVARCLLESLLLSCGSWEIVKRVELMAVTVVALTLGLR